MSPDSPARLVAAQRPFDHLVFDLDDTLLDTYRQLIPQASREACIAMIEAGLDTDLAGCLAARDEFAGAKAVRGRARLQLFEHLVQKLGTREGCEPAAVAKCGSEAFHNRRVEPNITLFAGARELLAELRESYGPHLVTAGHRETQEAKIQILRIAPLFSSIHVVDPARGERKRSAFERIQSSTGARPERHLSVGNRLDTDIGEARSLGWKGCWVRYGEYAHLDPATECEKPDFQVDGIMELKSVCQL